MIHSTTINSGTAGETKVAKDEAKIIRHNAGLRGTGWAED